MNKCPTCGSTNLIKKGYLRLADGTQSQRYYCKDCKARPTDKTQKDERESTSYEQGDGYVNIVCNTRRLQTVDDVIAHYKIDLDEWKIDRYEIKTQEAWRKDREVEWNVTEGHVTHGRVRDSGKLLLVPLTHISVRLVPKSLEDIGVKDITRFFESYVPTIKPKTIKRPKRLSTQALEICLADFHNGRQTVNGGALSPGDKFKMTIEDIMKRAKNKRFSVVYFVPLGDIYEVDNMKRTTTNGTQQFLTTTPYDMFRGVSELFIWGIDRLRELAPVKYVFIPGNHDEFASFALAETLRLYYSKCNDVTFDNTESRHKWQIYGVNLIAWTHGDMPKSNVFAWLQSKARMEWGQTKYSEVHAGHTHTQTVEEKAGQIVRFLPSVADASAWEDGQGYPGNVKSTVSFVWDSALGLQEQWFSNIV